jgi:hypothetical protein
MSENTTKPINPIASSSGDDPPKRANQPVQQKIARPFSPVPLARQRQSPRPSVRERIVGPFNRYPRVNKPVAKPITPAKRDIEIELDEVREAWATYQSTNGRDAVYLYLEAVFALVRRWQRLNCALKNSQATLRLQADAPQMKPEPFGIIIFVTADLDVADSKMRSKWSRALRYAKQAKPESATEFIKLNGGINACARLFARASK